MDTSAIMDLDIDGAVAMAGHAAQFAAALNTARQAMSEPVTMPLFPPGAVIAEPRTVRGSLRRLVEQRMAA